jgi:hypothetical protein
MKKQDALYVFGGLAGTGQALGLTTQAVSKWPEELPLKYVDRVVGGAFRLGLEHRLPPGTVPARYWRRLF